jgi:hypothetical protein
MNISVLFQFPIFLPAVIIFLLIILFNWLGFRYKKRQIRKNPEQVQDGIGSIEGSILGIMSFIMGFTFSMAVIKFESRRHLIVEEANYITTAIFRCDMYPDSIRNPLRADFAAYVEARIAYFSVGEDEDKINLEIKKAEEIWARIWKRVTYYSNFPDFRIRSQQMIPVLNDVIDIVNTRDATRVSTVPLFIMWTLLLLVLIAAFLLGSDYKGHKRKLTLVIGYAMVMALTMNLIIELNHTRKGLINLEKVEQKIINLRGHFQEAS